MDSYLLPSHQGIPTTYKFRSINANGLLVLGPRVSHAPKRAVEGPAEASSDSVLATSDTPVLARLLAATSSGCDERLGRLPPEQMY